MAETGRNPIARDTCYFKMSVPGPQGCVSPAPRLVEPNVGVWEVFIRAARGGGVAFQGLDGVPVGIRPESAESLARTLGVPWNAQTLDFFSIIEGYWRADILRQVEAKK